MPFPVPGPVGPGFAGVGGAVAGVIAGGAEAAASAGGDILGALPGADTLGTLTDTARAVRAWVSDRHNWTRVAWFASGSVMFTVGALMLGERPAAKATTAVVAPVGRVVKSAYKG
jgi:hypothetical protein